MSTYVTMMKLTDQGAKSIKEAPDRLQAGIKAWEGMGGKVLGVYATMGEYDYVTIGEAPNDEVMMAFRMAISALGQRSYGDDSRLHAGGVRNDCPEAAVTRVCRQVSG